MTSTNALKAPGDSAMSSAMTRAITVRNQTVSPLLRLPGEIRNKIYAYASHNNALYVNTRSGRLQNHENSRGLIFACRQTLAEAKQICMEEVVLQFPPGKGLFIFRKRVPASTLAPIRRISFPMEVTRLILDCHDHTNAASVIGSRLVSLDTVFVCAYWDSRIPNDQARREIITDRLVKVTGNQSLKVVFGLCNR
ncbi:hypothetical protein P171DRAFT_487372 [Karstenula rhodostoma CBS 690.94]|uniref:Uncharacterized protein n=1 Tax=Karstenula rhodostoma CBS 690.94 TaxID=1392251 RepID=A0A9P4U8B2_9PLEO|nr:hypothetical protein P171DRAFT_487372 [Karstenula rhodostoma CBS 690.94]